MKQFGLYKKEKLCSATAIDKLFGPGGYELSRLAYPLRIVAANEPTRRSDAPVAFLISVPKKRLHHAVDRVKTRRRIREAYRLLHSRFPIAPGLRVNVAFIYVANEPLPYARIHAAMEHLLGDIHKHFSAANEPDCQ